jgi:signal transduction histidine kinase
MFGVVTTTVLLVSLSLSHDLEWTAYLTLSTVLTGLVVYGISSLSSLVREVDRARTELARGAVTRERLRVARELRGRIGELLTAITVRGESVVRLLPGSPEPARAEVAEMLDLARSAVSHIRVVATGYRHMSFTAELDLAASALAAAGVQVDLRVPADGVPPQVDPLLALVLREAVTAVIRHSGARTCTVTVTIGDGAVRLRLTNDGANPPAGAGTGFDDLAERLRAVGGKLSTETADGTFCLVADLPLTVPAGQTAHTDR